MTRCILSSLALVGFLTGCSTTEAYRINIVRPATVDLGRFERVAVDDFSGQGGVELARELSEALAGATNALTGAVSFEVTDREDFERSIEDIWKKKGRLDSNTIAKLEKLGKARLMIGGEIDAYEVNERLGEAYWIDETGEHVTYTLTAVGRVSVTVEAIDTRTNKIVDRAVFDERVTHTTQAIDVLPRPIDHEGLLAAARRQVVTNYVRRVVPHEDAVLVTLFVDKEFPQLKLGNVQASTGAWEEAISSYREALDLMTGEMLDRRFKGLYNLGVALLYANRFDEARKAFQEAYTLEENDVILRQLQSVSVRESEYRQLQEQRTPEETATPADLHTG